MILPDILAPGLRAVFCGTAVGTASARAGHYYAGRGNEFWSLLYDSGLTARRLRPEEDSSLLTFGLGLTDIVKQRSASSDALLEGENFDVPGFIERLKKWERGWVAFNGKTSARVVAKTVGHHSIHLGQQPWTVAGIPAFVVPSTSGANRRRDYEGRPDRLAWFREFALVLNQVEAGTR